MFSVVIPYYKKRQYIERCLDSVISQTYQDFEIILVDDGSSDDLNQLVEHKYKDKLTLITQSNQGVSSARNTGIENVSQDYIAFLDADDCWSPNYLELAVKLILRDKKLKILGSKYTRSINNLEVNITSLSYRKIENYFQRQAIKNPLFTSSSTIIKGSFFRENAGFNSNLKSGEDMDVWFRTVLSGGNAYYIDNILVYYSDEDENQATGKNIDFEDRFVAHFDKIYFKNGIKIYPDYFYTFLSKYVYSGLYFLYFHEETSQRVAAIINNVPKKYFFAKLYYLIPQKVGFLLLKNRKMRRLAINYFKFIFTYIYTK